MKLTVQAFKNGVEVRCGIFQNIGDAKHLLESLEIDEVSLRVDINSSDDIDRLTEFLNQSKPCFL